jgi:hypothetical protein
VGALTGFLQFLTGSMILDDGIGGLSGDLAVTTLERPGFNPPGGGIKLFANFAAAAGAIAEMTQKGWHSFCKSWHFAWLTLDKGDLYT